MAIGRLPDARRVYRLQAQRISAATFLRITTIDMLWPDLKFAVRGLIGAPGLSAAAVLALVLGIGPNIAIFSIVYATLLAPLPYPDPDQLVRISPMVRPTASTTCCMVGLRRSPWYWPPLAFMR